MADNENQQNQGRQDTQGGAESAADATGSTAPATEPEGTTEGDQRAAGDTERDEATETSDVQALRREAASRRRALRVAEKERDQLRERVDTHDRAEVERIVAGTLADPSDLWGAVELDALREGGAVDEAKVGEAVAALLASKPHYAKAQHRIDLHQGVRQAEPERKSFGAALKRDGGR